MKMLLFAVMPVQISACDGDSSTGSATPFADNVVLAGSVPDSQMISVKPDRYTRVVRINPFPTLIVKIVQSLPGGTNVANIKAATRAVTQTLGFGLDPDLVPEPIRSPVTDANAASLLKASEALGEMIRRTRDRVAATGRPDPRITAVAKLVSGQVLVEMLANTLRVGVSVATAVTTRPSLPPDQVSAVTS